MAKTLIVGGQSSDFATIQAAVTAAGAGDLILIRAGTYTEQVTIQNKNGLTIRPITPDAVVEIRSPEILSVNGDPTSYGFAVRAVVGVNNSRSVVIENIIVHGAFSGDTTPGSGGDEIAGISLIESSATIRGVRIENVSNSSGGGQFGLQHGSGLFVDGGVNAPDLRVQVFNSTITDFQKTGAFINGVKLEFTGNIITGVGATAAIAQNGLQVSNVDGKIENNRITEFGYTGGDNVYSAGIAGFEPSGALRIALNVVKGAPGVGAGSAGIDFTDTGGRIVTIERNTLSDLGFGVAAYTFDRGAGLDPGPRIQLNELAGISEKGLFLEPELSGFGTTTRFDQDGTKFADYLAGSNGSDTFNGLDGDDDLFGRGGNDRLTGGGGSDYIDGGAGDDTIDGGDGDDILIGGAGLDRVTGGNGNDIFVDGAGNDRYTGGAGSDTFDFRTLSGADIVADFNAGNVLDLIKFGLITSGGQPVTKLDTNNDGKITGADGDGPRDLVVLNGTSLVFQFDQGTVTLSGIKSIAASQVQIDPGMMVQQSNIESSPFLGMAGRAPADHSFLV